MKQFMHQPRWWSPYLALLFCFAVGYWWTAAIMALAPGNFAPTVLVGAIPPWVLLRMRLERWLWKESAQTLLYELHLTPVSAPQALKWLVWPHYWRFLILVTLGGLAALLWVRGVLLYDYYTEEMLTGQRFAKLMLLHTSNWLCANLWIALLGYISFRRALVKNFLWPARHYTSIGILIYAILALSFPALLMAEMALTTQADSWAGWVRLVLLVWFIELTRREWEMAKDVVWRER